MNERSKMKVFSKEEKAMALINLVNRFKGDWLTTSRYVESSAISMTGNYVPTIFKTEYDQLVKQLSKGIY
jgi:hypothetical protein